MKHLFPISIFLVVFLSFYQTEAQSNSLPLKTQYGLGVSVKLMGKTGISFNRIWGFDLEGHDLNYIQNTFNFYYKIHRNWKLKGGLTQTVIPQEVTQNISKFRLFGALSVRSKMKIWRIYNELRFEKQGADENRYSERLVYSVVIQPKSNLISKKLRITPFVGGKLYYNFGGKSIVQYDKEGQFVKSSAPYGLHRFRTKAGISFKLVKGLKITS